MYKIVMEITLLIMKNEFLLVAKWNSHFEPDQPIKLTQGLFCLCEPGIG